MGGTLDGKVAIVTGAGRGIGRGEALTLAAAGAAVVVNDLDEDAARAVVAEIGASGGRATTSGHDAAAWDGAEGLVKQAVADHGRLDILVNNAGFLRDGMSFKLTEEAWDDVIRVHLRGHFAPSRFAAAHWRQRAKAGDPTVAGRIVNTVSEAGLYGGTGQANYVAAKAGIAAMTIALARELRSYGVTVNAIAPRARTRMTEALLGDFAATPEAGFDEWDPLNIAPTVAWLASDAAADVTGQVLVVFGGRIHRMVGWSLADEIEQDGRWTAAAIESRRDELFGPTGPGLPRMGFGR